MRIPNCKTCNCIKKKKHISKRKMQSKRYQLENKALFGNRNVCTCYIFLGCEIASAIKNLLHSNFLKMAPRQRWCPVNLLHIFRTLFLNNSYWRLLLLILTCLHKTWLNVLILITRCWCLHTGTPKSFFRGNQKQYEFGSQRFFHKNSVGTPILNLELFTWSNL